MLRATTACTFLKSQLPKVVRTSGVFIIFTSKFASRHNTVHFFNISTSKNAPKLKLFVHVDFKMCFAPHCCALFQHLNLQKCSGGPEMFFAFLLGNVLRVTTRALFEHLNLNVQKWSEHMVFLPF